MITNMDISREQIVRTVLQIIVFIRNQHLIPLRGTNYEEFHRQIYDQFTDFANRFPSLFRLILEDPDNFQLDRLKQMLNQREQVRNGSLTPEAASIKVGQEYFDEFVKDRVPST
jgi:hypothetical protein